MYCPRCGTSESDDLKFCKSCGANLFAVRRVVDTKGTIEKKISWGDAGVAEMFLSSEELERQKAAIERQRAMKPEVKRYKEIKAGVIASSVGIGVAIFLYFLMQGVILGGEVRPGEAEILSRLWVAGVIPLMVGLALILNGAVVSKRLAKIASEAEQAPSNRLEGDRNAQALGSGETTEFIPSSYSVTEQTTKHLRDERK